MVKTYVPILKLKKGELDALVNLSDSVKNKIIPLMEIPSDGKQSITNFLNSTWPERYFYFYFMPTWYNNNFNSYLELLDHEVVPLVHSTDKAIPVLDLSMLIQLNDLTNISSNGIAIRIHDTEFEQIESDLNAIFDRALLDRTQTDLIIDLGSITDNTLSQKEEQLKHVFANLDAAAKFHSIIISSASFPKNISSVKSGEIGYYKRLENDIMNLSLKLSKRFGFNYQYSDYGLSDTDEFTFIPGMTIAFKIKYTTKENYICIKGSAINKGGLDISNVQSLAKILVDSPHFSGSNYSWSDEKIYLLSQKQLSSPGNLTTWVSYAVNHHITFISNIL